MRVIYIGCVESSYVFLKALIENKTEIVGVITKESSSFNSDFVDITPLCKEADIPYIFVNNVNDENSKEFIKKCNPDIGYCFGWSQLISNEIIDLFSMGMVGYHPAALPNNRGRHPIIWALALGLNQTASSFFMIEKTADTGNIIAQTMVDISYDDDARTLMDKLLLIGKDQVINFTKKFENGTIEYISQKQNEGNSWRKRNKIDGQIDWRMSSKSIYNLVRALTKPYAGSHLLYDNKEIKVWKVKEIIDNNNKYKNIEPGKVVDIIDNHIVVKTGENLIELIEYDKVEIKIGEYL